MSSKSGAGAAVSSGAGYQARVGAYLIVTAICSVDSIISPATTIATFGFETTESVDDINVSLNDGSSIFIQAKAKIDYSLSEGGELRSVLKQFESQESRRPHPSDKFVLITSGRSSKKLIYDTRAALSAFRTSPDHEFFRDQPKALIEIISDLRRTLSELQIQAGRQHDADIIDRVIRKSEVVVLDVDSGDQIEQASILLIESRKFVSPSALWGKIVADCVNHSKARHTLSVAETVKQYSRYQIDVRTNEAQVSDELLNIEFGAMKFPVGREVVLGYVSESSSKLSRGPVIMEFYRFDNDCNERIKFSENTFTLGNGLSITLLRRAATFTGLTRLTDADPKLLGEEKLTIYPINSDEDFEAGLCAEVHRERLKKAALSNLNRPGIAGGSNS